MFHGLGPLVCFESELTSGTMNPFRHIGWTPSTGDQPIIRPLLTQDSTSHKKRRHQSVHRAGSEYTIPVFGRSITIRALDRAATGTGRDKIKND